MWRNWFVFLGPSRAKDTSIFETLAHFSQSDIELEVTQKIGYPLPRLGTRERVARFVGGWARFPMAPGDIQREIPGVLIGK